MPIASCGFDDAWALARRGPTLAVKIGFDPDFQPENSTPPNIPTDSYEALVDTGAELSGIDNDLAARLGLPIVGRLQMAGVHGIAEVNMYIGQIFIPFLHATFYSKFAGAALRSSSQGHDALIGRDFLKNGTMIYEGRTGVVTIET